METTKVQIVVMYSEDNRMHLDIVLRHSSSRELKDTDNKKTNLTVEGAPLPVFLKHYTPPFLDFT